MKSLRTNDVQNGKEEEEPNMSQVGFIVVQAA